MSVTAEDQVDEQEAFSIREARRIVHDLFEPDLSIYWTDLLVSLAVGLSGLAVLSFSQWNSWPAAVAYVVAVLAFYRVGSFTHELVHLRHPRFASFRVAWNIACGVPFFMPSFTYHTHMAHHARNHYGTKDDGEYLPLAVGPARDIVWCMVQPLFIPILAIIRFVVFTPIAWLHPGFRRWVQQRASSLVIDPSYVRPLPSTDELRVWKRQEAFCFGYGVAALVALLTGILPVENVVKVYFLAVGVVGLNQLRTLGAHRFRHRGEELTFLEQLLDSVNYPRWPLLTGLWAPIGLRYHALHHLFPAIPYHNLHEAHQRLMAQLPADSPYRQTISPGLWAALSELWRSARSSGAARSGGSREVQAAG